MKRLMMIAVAFALLLGTSAVFAQVSYYDGPGSDNGTEDNTDAGTQVENIVTVTYEVNGVAQTAEDNTDINGDGLKFTVDRAILFTVSKVADDTAQPGQTGQPLEFTITNDSNDTLDFVLAASNVGTGDDFQVNNLTIYQDDTVDAAGVVGSFDPTDDLIAGNRLTNMAEGDTITVFVVSDIPSSSFSDGDTADVVLMATAYNTAGEGGGIVIETNTASADDPNFEDTVFGDPDGTFDDGAGDTDDAQDGRDSDTGTYTITSASITVTKDSTVLSDPFNLATNPKAIPGAEVLYCIEVTNTGGTTAENVTVRDPIPTGTTYVDESIEVFTGGITCAAALVNTGTSITDDDLDAAAENTANSGISGNSGDSAASPAEATDTVVNTTVSSVAATTGVTATIFRVTID